MLNLLSFLVGPVAIVCLLVYYSWNRRRQLAPPLLPIVFLALASMSIQIGGTGPATLDLFQQIATQKSSGVLQVSVFLIESGQGVMWRVAEDATCILGAALFQAVFWRRGSDEAVPPAEKNHSLAFAGMALSVVAVCWLFWFSSDIASIIGLLTDSTRVAEARLRLGAMDMGQVAQMLTNRLFVLSIAASMLAQASFCLGIWSIEHLRPRRGHAAFASVLALAVLGSIAAVGVPALHNISHLRQLMTSNGGAVPPWFAGLVPFAE